MHSEVSVFFFLSIRDVLLKLHLFDEIYRKHYCAMFGETWYIFCPGFFDEEKFNSIYFI